MGGNHSSDWFRTWTEAAEDAFAHSRVRRIHVSPFMQVDEWTGGRLANPSAAQSLLVATAGRRRQPQEGRCSSFTVFVKNNLHRQSFYQGLFLFSFYSYFFLFF